MLEKLTPKKKNKNKRRKQNKTKNAGKKTLSWKASIFSRSELSVLAQSIPGCLSLSSFGSLALQFSFTSWLEASEAPLAPHAAGEKARGAETKAETVWVKSTLSCKKQPPESFMATHGPFSLYSTLFLQFLHLYPRCAPFSDVCVLFFFLFFFFHQQ